ncbi:unnamed protein product [Ceratitis capitata]|uniref:(Mediterranean fruit fly) hypothetical protein n=1 Tax=Ceratitis capitata TaxID=7213 RepID=A0A811UBD2_CERCA|nr:unnamed protein product [Ceratitis capitata]
MGNESMGGCCCECGGVRASSRLAKCLVLCVNSSINSRNASVRINKKNNNIHIEKAATLKCVRRNSVSSSTIVRLMSEWRIAALGNDHQVRRLSVTHQQIMDRQSAVQETEVRLLEVLKNVKRL